MEMSLFLSFLTKLVCMKKCFQVLDSAAMDLALKMKEAIHIKHEHPSLNSQVCQP